MLDENAIKLVLEGLAAGEIDVEQAAGRLKSFCTEDLGFARLDHHRALRQGFAEVVYCDRKTPDEVATIVESVAARHGRVLGTRASSEQFEAAAKRVSDVQYNARGRVLWVDRHPREKRDGIVVVCAGTGDLPVVEEAWHTLEVMGHQALRICDAGVAGLHRVIAEIPTLQSANVIIAIAGMEGALPSVVGGLVSCPVIAVPTSVGYGASLNGMAALLAMLNSCASGISVVNIDNGFGAACVAARINDLAYRGGNGNQVKLSSARTIATRGAGV